MTGIRAARKLSLPRRPCVVAALVAAVASTAAALAGCTPGGTEGSSDYVRYRGIVLNEQTRDGVEGVSVSVDTDPAPSVVFTDDEGAFHTIRSCRVPRPGRAGFAYVRKVMNLTIGSSILRVGDRKRYD